MIELKDVYKTLGRRPVLQGLSFHVEPGETFILVGPSGTGKSVTLSHIIGLMNPDSGTVTVDGMEVSSLSRKELENLRLKLGMLFQGGALLNWLNIYDNVALPLRERTRMTEEQISAKVMEMLDFLELDTLAKISEIGNYLGLEKGKKCFGIQLQLHRVMNEMREAMPSPVAVDWE